MNREVVMTVLLLCSADELLLTEMVFNGLFNALDVTQTAALLSCFVCDEKSNEMPKLSEALSGPLKQVVSFSIYHSSLKQL